MQIHTPDWVKHAVFYQIFPDRFSRSAYFEKHLGLTFKEWGTPPEDGGYQGGDLYGIADRLDYLQDLGVTAIYLCPIFSSASNHGYHTFDYYQVNPLFGGNKALKHLLEACHARDMKLVLDGVFNHASRGFWPFHHILENGGNSPYIDWFTVRGWPLRPYSSNKENPTNYDAWWNLPALPKLNFKNPGVRQYILGVAQHWIEFGIDGWRLDVAEEIKDESFWHEFRRVVKGANPEAYICGEIWRIAPEWLQGDRFDALMNYPLGFAGLGFFGHKSFRKDAVANPDHPIEPLDGKGLDKKLNELFDIYDWEITTAQLNLFDSHDTARALYLLGNNKNALRQAIAFQMTMPGAPCIYYGDEIGMSSKMMPYCRAAFPWHLPDSWDKELLSDYQNLIAVRKSRASLRTGAFQTLHADSNSFVYSRRLGDDLTAVAFNRDDVACELQVNIEKLDKFAGDLQTIFTQGENSLRMENGQLILSITGRGTLILAN